MATAAFSSYPSRIEDLSKTIVSYNLLKWIKRNKIKEHFGTEYM